MAAIADQLAQDARDQGVAPSEADARDAIQRATGGRAQARGDRNASGDARATGRPGGVGRGGRHAWRPCPVVARRAGEVLPEARFSGASLPQERCAPEAMGVSAPFVEQWESSAEC
ncbi:hypothetical protein QJS66_13840 [Kocuria rhizophila]|nr:hypothetical protein QJS66_13840 [Kocuria rhizophila]